MQRIYEVKNAVKLLVLIDDQKSISLFEIEKHFHLSKRIIIANLTRLVKQDFVRSESHLYYITPLGESWLDEKLKILAELKLRQKRTFHLIFIKKYQSRSKKNSFVEKLKQFGFVTFSYQVMLGNSPAVSTVRNLAKHYQIKELDIVPIEFKEDYLKLWDLKKADEKYHYFINNVKEILAGNRFLTTARVQAKLSVYIFADIINNDPRFNLDLPIKNNYFGEALDYYKKIRPLCYK